MKSTKIYIPKRRDIAWIDFDPALKGEMGKYRPALILSSHDFNKRGICICCPISTSIRNATTEVPVHGLEKPCVLMTEFVFTYSWRNRNAKLIQKADKQTYNKALMKIMGLIGADDMMKTLMTEN